MIELLLYFSGPGALTITPNDGETLIGPTMPTGVTDVRIKMRDGDDLVFVDDLEIEGDVEIDGGDGIDTFIDGGGNTFPAGSPDLDDIELVLP